MKALLNHLYEHHTLTRDEACETLQRIGQGEFTAVQVTAFLSVYQMRSITVEELSGFRDALLSLCIPIDLSVYNPIDLCGTGGDGKDTFNISTLASFVVAGAGIPVAKHGNYGVSSVCGSSNVLEHFGFTFTNDQGKLERQLSETGICFLHAPLFHPAMKHVAPVRRQLGVKTFFNMLGPLVNPARPPLQVVGVYALELARRYHYLFQQEEHAYTIVHALDGYDEISLTGPFKSITRDAESILTPSELGFSEVKASDLYGGEKVEDAAQIFINVLNDEATPEQKNVVIANAGLAIHRAKPDMDIASACSVAKETLESKRALDTFKKLLAA